MKYSVNCCRRCKRQLTIIADKLGYNKCAECNYFDSIGVYSIEDYNEWLKKI